MTVVLDASVLLAVLFDEENGSAVEQATVDGAVSAVNLSEAVAKLVERGYPLERARTLLGRLTLNVHPFTDQDAYAAGGLRTSTKRAGLSFGDRACLALAQRLSLPVMTADRAWATLAVGVEVRVIR